MTGIEVGEWTTEWPIEEGLYWFYGWIYGRKLDKEPKLELVKALWLGSVEKGSMSFTTNGGFLYKSEGGEGYFQKIIQPALPDLSQLVKETS
jgi:hypothetical protein